MAKKDLTDEQLVALIEDRESKSYGIFDSELTDDRTEAINYYNGEPFGNEVEGRSQVVSRDVLDTIESALPQLLKVFVAGDEIVRFDPRGPEDEAAAEQETAAVNYFVIEKNDGFAVFYTWFKDALLSKNGYVKVWYEDKEEVETETYQGLTEEQMVLMLKDDRIEVIEHTQYQDEIDIRQREEALAQVQDPQQAQAIMSAPPKFLHDVKISITDKRGCIEICNVAPEDILIGYDTRTVSLQEASFVQHRALMDRAEIDEQGWDVPEDIQSFSDSSRWEEQIARSMYNEDEELIEGLYLVKDTYIRVDGELRNVVIIGNTVVYNEEAEIIPFACVTPHIMPHRHIGMSYADLTKDIQITKSALMRGVLDAQYLSNAPRFAVSDRVNLNDMLTNRPGGVVRVEGDPMSAIMPLQAASAPPVTFNVIEYLDSAKEKRTGITAYNQGLDSNSLNKTATGTNQIMQATQQRIELVARTFANTGVKELFMLVHRLVRKYYTRPEIIRLKGEWVPVDPREWKERKDMSVVVGLGTGNKDQQLIHLQTIATYQAQALQAGLPIVTPENFYNTARQIAINAGFKNPEMFWTDPKNVPPKPQQPDPKMMVEKMKLDADANKFKAETQIKQQEEERKAQLEIQKFQAQAEIDQRQAEQNAMLEQQRSENDLQIEREKMALEAELKRFEMELKAQTDLQIAQINAEIEAQKWEREAVLRQQEAERSERMHAEKLNAMMRPKSIVRDENGTATGLA